MQTMPSPHLDGNVLAGPLAEYFTFDVTTAIARCAGCHTAGMLATAMVYVDDMGYVARCANCDNALVVVVLAPGHARISMPGVSSLEMPSV